MKSYLFGIATVIVFILAGGAIFIWSGIYNVAADVPHYKLTFLLLDEARESSVLYHSKGIEPEVSDERTALETGFSHYHETCRLCHGAPGISR